MQRTRWTSFNIKKGLCRSGAETRQEDVDGWGRMIFCDWGDCYGFTCNCQSVSLLLCNASYCTQYGDTRRYTQCRALTTTTTTTATIAVERSSGLITFSGSSVYAMYRIDKNTWRRRRQQRQLTCERHAVVTPHIIVHCLHAHVHHHRHHREHYARCATANGSASSAIYTCSALGRLLLVMFCMV